MADSQTHFCSSRAYRAFRYASVALLAMLLCGLPATAQKQKKDKGKSGDSADQHIKLPMPDEQAIDVVISEMLGAWQIGDVERMHKAYADDVVVVSGLWEPPVVGWDKYVKAYQQQRARMETVRMDRLNTLIKVQGNIGWASYQWDFSGIVDGRSTGVRGQTTLVLQKRDTRWVVVHNHTSVLQEVYPRQPAAAPAAPPAESKPPAKPDR